MKQHISQKKKKKASLCFSGLRLLAGGHVPEQQVGPAGELQPCYGVSQADVQRSHRCPEVQAGKDVCIR